MIKARKNINNNEITLKMLANAGTVEAKHSNALLLIDTYRAGRAFPIPANISLLDMRSNAYQHFLRGFEAADAFVQTFTSVADWQKLTFEQAYEYCVKCVNTDGGNCFVQPPPEVWTRNACMTWAFKEFPEPEFKGFRTWFYANYWHGFYAGFFLIGGAEIYGHFIADADILYFLLINGEYHELTTINCSELVNRSKDTKFGWE